MINETLNTSINSFQNISFNSWTQITTSTPFIIAILSAWLIPIVFYLIIASTRKARTASGRKLEISMLSTSNALIPLIIWIFLQGLLILVFVVIPLWLKIII